jgi:hypothetical protein
MREIRSYGSARGVPGNRHSYRNCIKPNLKGAKNDHPIWVAHWQSVAWDPVQVSCFHIMAGYCICCRHDCRASPC